MPSGVKDTMSLSFTAPEAPGQLFFEVIQGCEVGSNDWIDEWDGTGEEPERPAPSVMVVAAAGGDDDGSSNGLAIAGIVLGAAGLGVGGTGWCAGARTGDLARLTLCGAGGRGMITG